MISYLNRACVVTALPCALFLYLLQGLEYDTVVLADDFSFEPLVGGRQDVWGSGEQVRHGLKCVEF